MEWVSLSWLWIEDSIWETSVEMEREERRSGGGRAFRPVFGSQLDCETGVR